MKEAISGTSLFMIVIFFVVVFTGYLCFTINQSRAFSVKNSIIRIVERYGVGKLTTEQLSLDPNFRADIQNELTNVGYRTTGVCDDGWDAFDVNGSKVVGNVGAFCVKVFTNSTGSDPHSPVSKLHYFTIKTFYHFDIPGFSKLLRLTVEGNTKSMQ